MQFFEIFSFCTTSFYERVCVCVAILVCHKNQSATKSFRDDKMLHKLRKNLLMHAKIIKIYIHSILEKECEEIVWGRLITL